MSLNLFNQVLYINLNYRKDRKKTYLKKLSAQRLKKLNVYRLSLMFLTGQKVVFSVILARLNVEKKEKTTLILEDDCCFTKDIALFNRVIKN